jgi:hypothetical protein
MEHAPFAWAAVTVTAAAWAAYFAREFLMMSLLRLSSNARKPAKVERRVRLSLEALEAREVPSASPMLPHVPPTTALFSPASSHASPVGALNSALHQVAALPPITITGVTLSTTGQLTANGTIGSHTFSTPVTITTSTAAGTGTSAATSTPILNLHLAPIDLNVLGLEVKTSEICLNVSAQSGSGNLLGNLLGGIANSLNGGASLGSILGGLTSAQQSTLTGGLTGLLNGGLAAVNTQATASPSPLANDILHLSLGPVNLNLLGLNVNLDNCAGGPITVDVIANTGPGDLLGNLVSDASHLFDNVGNLPTALSQRLDQIAALVVADAGLLGL